ncbi:MAG: hypothetical protein KDA25_09255 [Phycisphaerales bacterium]|nr:hypothetical protein [Phycisphaerales bacterium]
MNSIKRAGFLASAVTLSFGATTLADVTTDTVNEDLRIEVAQLRAEVARMSASETDNWLTEQRATQIRGLVNDVLADADTRASLLQSGAGAGWDNGFFLASPDGNFRLNLAGQIQTRYAFNYTENGPDQYRAGFVLPNTQLFFSGHVVDPTWQYMIQLNYGNAVTTGVLQDAYVTKDLENGWSVTVGQFKAPLLRETLIFSGHQLAVDRSLIESTFGGGRTQGIAVAYETDQWRMVASFNDGAATSNTGALVYDTEWSFTARGEFLAAGTWEQFQDYTSWNGEEYGALIGGALHYQSGEYGTAATETETFIATIDAQIEGGGWNAAGYFVYRSLDVNGGTNADQYGFVVQGGINLAEDTELFGRFEYGDDDTAADELMIITVGINKYFAKHQVKWTTDVGFALDGVTATFADATKDWRTTPTTNDSEYVIKTQLQLLF